MDNFLRELDTFDLLLKKKGYDTMFMTNSGFPGHLKDSVKAYLRESLLGNENGLQKGFTLSCYLKWKDHLSPRVFCFMDVKCNANLQFEVKKMNLNLQDQYGKCMKEKELEISSNDLIPRQNQAVKMAQELSVRKRKPRFGL